MQALIFKQSCLKNNRQLPKYDERQTRLLRETDRTPLLSGQGPGTPRRVPPQDHDDMMNAPLTHESTPRGGCELWQTGSGSRLVVNLTGSGSRLVVNLIFKS